MPSNIGSGMNLGQSLLIEYSRLTHDNIFLKKSFEHIFKYTIRKKLKIVDFNLKDIFQIKLN